jgi:peptidoglycan/xylan/chitin deacetylase (PgdA/CDA1 family)
MYHDVIERGADDASGFAGADAARYKIERERFAAHLDAIATRVRETTRVFDPSIREVNSFTLTFDDGGVSAYTCVAEMLERRGWRGHFFVTTDNIGTPTFLSRAQIQELHQRGHVIGSHSCSHPMRMSHCSRAEMLKEWRTSVEVLSEILGERVRAASVPGGYYSREVAETAAQARIEVLFTSEPTTRTHLTNGCRVLGRYMILHRTAPEIAAALASGEITPRLRQSLVWKAKKVTKALGGKHYLRVRNAFLGQG